MRRLLTTPEIRSAHIVELRPEICTLDLNTQWFGGGAVINSPRSIKAMAERMYAAGSKPELEIFNTGDIMLAHDLVADGTLKMRRYSRSSRGSSTAWPRRRR